MNSKNTPKTTTVALMCAIAVIPSLHATVLLNDTFADADRTNANLPGSAAWYLVGAGATGMTPTATSVVSSGALLTTSRSGLALSAAFTGTTGQTIAVGGTLRLTFSVTLSFNGGTGADSFRFGLFDSNASQISSDGSGGNGSASAFGNWDGYSFWSPYGSVTGATSAIRERTGTDNILWGSTPNTSRATTAYPASSVVNATPYTGELALTRTATGLNVSGTLGGNSVSYTDINASVDTFTFDSISFFVGGTPIGSGGSFTLDNVMVEIVPEPSALLLTALSSLALLRRRR